MIRGFGEEKYARKARGQKSRDPIHLGFRSKAHYHMPLLEAVSYMRMKAMRYREIQS